MTYGIEKRIGKIQKISFGFGGYQESQFGISVTVGSDKECWGVGSFRGHWGTERSDNCKWTEKDREEELGKMCLWVRDLLSSANKTQINQLVGVPVEVLFDGMNLKSWRILTEAI